jgi:TonB family protein
MRLRLWLLFGLWLLTAPASAVAAQSAGDYLQSLVGKPFILHGYGQKGGTLNKQDLEKKRGKCDVPVEVMRAERKKDSVNLQLQSIGRLVLEGKQVACSNQPGSFSFTIRGVAESDPPEAMRPVVEQLLKTPDAYLAAHGITLDLQETPAGATTEAGSGTRPVRGVLSVNAEYSDEARMRKLSGIVILAVTVGTDGRIHEAKVIKDPGGGLARQALRVLPLYRMHPARRDGKPVASQTTLEMTFRIL